MRMRPLMLIYWSASQGTLQQKQASGTNDNYSATYKTNFLQVKMSTVSNIITISIPEHLVPGNTSESYSHGPVGCTYCHGKGFFNRKETRESCERDICPVCGGSGSIKAIITIEWGGMR